MTTARLRLIALACLLFCPAVGTADELLLHSGKVIHGRITSEDDESYRIKMRANMALRVSKSDVARVTRDVPKSAATPAPTKHSATPRPSPPAAAAPAPSPAEVKPAPAGSGATVAVTSAPVAGTVAEEAGSPPSDVSVRTIGVVTLSQAKMTTSYPVKGVTYDEALKFITDPVRGKGFVNRGVRRPARTQWRMTWYGAPAAGGTAWASLVVKSTVTTTMPEWSPKKPPSATDGARWEALLKESDEVEKAHVRIIQESLAAFAREASNLVAANEEDLRIQTGNLISDARVRSDKRRKGYDRRREEQKKKPVIRKKRSR